MRALNFRYAIVIVTYNRLNLLKVCLEHALHQTYPANSIIVIDNGSTDGTADYLDEQRNLHKALLITHITSNIGGAGGFERGLRLANEKTTADWFMLIDDDAILDYSCMGKMNPVASTLKSNVYACAVKTDGEFDCNHRRSCSLISGQKIRNRSLKQAYNYDEFLCQYASFCGLMISRPLVQEIGYPEGSYFIWIDDTEYCMRFRAKPTCSIVVRTSSIIDHRVTLDPGNPTLTWKNYYGIRNMIHATKRHKLWLKFFDVIIHSIVKGVLTWLSHKANFRSEAKLYFDAVLDGVSGRLGMSKDYRPNISITDLK